MKCGICKKELKDQDTDFIEIMFHSKGEWGKGKEKFLLIVEKKGIKQFFLHGECFIKYHNLDK